MLWFPSAWPGVSFQTKVQGRDTRKSPAVSLRWRGTGGSAIPNPEVILGKVKVKNIKYRELWGVKNLLRTAKGQTTQWDKSCEAKNMCTELTLLESEERELGSSHDEIIHRKGNKDGPSQIKRGSTSLLRKQKAHQSYVINFHLFSKTSHVKTMELKTLWKTGVPYTSVGVFMM